MPKAPTYYFAKSAREPGKRFLTSCKIDVIIEDKRMLYSFIFRHVREKNGFRPVIHSRSTIAEERGLDLSPLIKTINGMEVINLKTLGVKGKAIAKSEVLPIIARFAKLYCRLIIFQVPPLEPWLPKDEKRILVMTNEMI